MLTIASYLVNSEGLAYLSDVAVDRSPESVIRVYHLFASSVEGMNLNGGKLTVTFKDRNHDVISGAPADLKRVMDSIQPLISC